MVSQRFSCVYFLFLFCSRCSLNWPSVKFGNASNFGFKNIAVSNIAPDGINAAGIALEIVDGGVMDGVSLTNFAMRDVDTAIFIRLGNMGRQWTSDQPKAGIGSLRNVVISNIVAPLLPDEMPLSGSITGLPGHPVENISISDVRIVAPRSHDSRHSQVDFKKVPEVPAGYPEYSMLGSLPSNGLYVRHVRGLTLRNVQPSSEGDDDRSVLIGDDVERLSIDGLQMRSLPVSARVLFFNDVRGASITGTTLWDEVPVFLRVEGQSAGIELTGNRLASAKQPVVAGGDAPMPTIIP